MHVSVQMHMCNDGTAIFSETHGVVNNKVPAVAVAISHHHQNLSDTDTLR